MDQHFLRSLNVYLDEMEQLLTDFSGHGDSAILPERFGFWLRGFHILAASGGMKYAEEIAGLSETILFAQEAAIFRKKGWPRKKAELLFQTLHLLREMLDSTTPAENAGDFANRIMELRTQLARGGSR